MWSTEASRWVWSDAAGEVEVRFFGRGPRLGDRAAELAAVAPDGVACAWAEQVHAATVLEATGPGLAGEGDALVGDARGLALSVATADCVPVLLAAGDRIGAIHAGWRGVAAGVVAATVERLWAAGAGDPAGWTAWLGPAIGGCCYEVGPEVAARVAAASTGETVLAWPGSDRPHLDLSRAVAAQLVTGGLADVRPLVSCTRCDAERLWSYRRDGTAAGRNLALIWKS